MENEENETGMKLVRDRKVLVVDDSIDMIMVLIDLLKKRFSSKVEFLFTNSVDESVELLRNENVHLDLIICDYEMPGKCGTELLNYLHRNHLNIPFVFFSGTSEEQIKSQVDLRPPFVELVKKPDLQLIACLLNKILFQKIHP